MVEAPAPLRDRTFAWVGLVLLTLAALGHNFPTLSAGAFNWAESGNTAAALVEGRGFSDPFAGGTGPTAWIPPIFVWVLAAVFSVAGIKSAAAAVILLALAVLGLAAAHAILIAALPPAARALRFGTSVVFLAGVTLFPSGPFEVMSEAWLNILLSTALLWSALEHTRAPRRGVTIALTLTCAIAPLTNAGLTVATAAVLLVLLARELRSARPALAWRGPVIAGVAAALALGGWTVRNAVTLHRFVPLKSNAWFEFNLSNVVTTDGIPRTEHVLTLLPLFSAPEFARYAALGEMAYVESFRAPTLAWLRADPGRFAAFVARRGFNAFVCSHFDGGAIVTKAAFTPNDTARLANAGWLLPISPGAAWWTRIDAPVAEAQAKVATLGLDDPAGVWRDWVAKRLEYDRNNSSVAALAQGFAIAGLPLLALLGVALATRGRLPAPVAWSALIAAAMLFPFVLVNHGLRQQGNLIALQALFLGACLQCGLDRYRAARAAAIP